MSCSLLNLTTTNLTLQSQRDKFISNHKSNNIGVNIGFSVS